MIKVVATVLTLTKTTNETEESDKKERNNIRRFKKQLCICVFCYP